MDSDRDRRPIFLFILIVLIIVFVGLFTPAAGIISFQIDKIKTKWFYEFHKPDTAVFVPQQANQLPVEVKTAIPTSTSVPVVTPASIIIPSPEVFFPTAESSPTASPTEEILPSEGYIKGVPYEDQHGVWNYCAPTNLSMVMNFWGWKGNRMDAGSWLKPFRRDKNVMFYELQEFVEAKSDLKSIVRAGGTPELMKKLILAGFPILIEKGAFMQEVGGNLSWMGHYNVIIGYDDVHHTWIVQDSYYKPDYKIDYDELDEEWKSFNYQFMIVYASGYEADLFALLENYTNEDWAMNQALEMADARIIPGASHEELFYAYFDRGSSLVGLQDYYGAASAFDMAFSEYPEIDTNRRPYRIVWYQTEPYQAYFYCGRYNDVISLATQTLDSASEPYFEESHYWRARAYVALEQYENARDDLDECLKLHTGFVACEELKTELGFE